MKKFILLMAVLLTFTACSRVTVPPASQGKILSGSGYSEDLKQPGKYWIPFWNSMVILDTSTQSVKETITVKMKDRLDLTFDVRFRTRIAGNNNVVNSMFNDIRHENYAVTLGMVYGIYGQDVVRSTARSIVGKYNTEEVAQNFDKVTQDLHVELTKMLASSPLEMSNITLAELVYPPVITTAIESQAERELAIETEANQQAIEMVKKGNELLLAQADYEIRMERARAIRDENKLTAEGLNDKLIQYRQLEVLEKIASGDNAVFVPYESLTNVGLSNRMFSQ